MYCLRFASLRLAPRTAHEGGHHTMPYLLMPLPSSAFPRVRAELHGGLLGRDPSSTGSETSLPILEEFLAPTTSLILK